MAAGAYVVGFHGDGAREYMRPEFSTTVEEPDLVALADAVVSAARRVETDPAWVSGTRQLARDFIKENYSRAGFDEKAVALFAQLEQTAGQSRQVKVRHFSWLGHRPLRRKAHTAIKRVRESFGPLDHPLGIPAAEGSELEGVSVVIAHYGDPVLASQAAADVLGQRTDRPVQVIVVDDASPTPFPTTPGIEVITKASNGGFGSAVNLGAAQARYPWLLILNSDMRLEPDFLEQFVVAAQSVQPAICSPQLVDQGGPAPTANLFRSMQPSAMVGALAPLGRWRSRGRFDRAVGHDTGVEIGRRAQTEWLTGACLLLRTSDFVAVAGFDESFHMFNEEIDLMRRLRDRGVVAWYLGDLQAAHLGGASTAAGSRTPKLLRSHFRYARKYHFAVRLRATAEGVAAVNLAYNMARDLAGKKVGAWATYSRTRAQLGTAWRESKT